MIGFELTVLSIYALFVIAVIVFQAALAAKQLGLAYILGPREDRHRLIGVAGRADRAAQNCVVSLALFAPAVLAVQVQGLNDSITLLAAQVFLGARVAYVFLYVASIPVLRSIAFLIGLSATVYLYFVAL